MVCGGDQGRGCLCPLLAILEHTQVQMPQLGQAVLEQGVLGVNQLLATVDAMLECDRRWSVLQASHLEGLHDGLIGAPIGMRLAVRVKADHLYRSAPVASLELQFVLDGDLGARPQLLYPITRGRLLRHLKSFCLFRRGLDLSLKLVRILLG